MKTYPRLIIFVLLITITAHQSIAQVSVNVDGSIPDASAMLDVQSTERGFLAPRMTMLQRDAIASPVTGLLIFQTDSTAGFYYFDGAAWGLIKTGGNAIDDLTDGKTGGSSLFLGTDAGIVDDGTTNENVAIGEKSLSNNTSGYNNTAIGFEASRFTDFGWYNTTIGSEANFWNTEGSNNTMIGYKAGSGTTPHSKSGNTFLGSRAGYYETGDNKLYIENSDTINPLIYGEFDNDFVRINGNIDINGNIGVGVDYTGNGENVLAMKYSHAPTASVNNSILLYTDSINILFDNWTAELRVRDEAGFVTTLSPHNFSMLPKSEPMAWSFYSENSVVGKKMNVDMLRAIRLVEEISGEKLVCIKDIDDNSKYVETKNNNTGIIEQQQKDIEALSLQIETLLERIEELEKK